MRRYELMVILDPDPQKRAKVFMPLLICIVSQQQLKSWTVNSI